MYTRRSLSVADLYYFYRQKEIVNEINSVAILNDVELKPHSEIAIYAEHFEYTHNAIQLALLIRHKHVCMWLFVSLRIFELKIRVVKRDGIDRRPRLHLKQCASI